MTCLEKRGNFETKQELVTRYIARNMSYSNSNAPQKWLQT